MFLTLILHGRSERLREENVTLSHVRHDYEEACDRLCSSDKALEDARRELEMSRKRSKVLGEQVAHLEMEVCTRLENPKLIFFS